MVAPHTALCPVWPVSKLNYNIPWDFPYNSHNGGDTLAGIRNRLLLYNNHKGDTLVLEIDSSSADSTEFPS